MKLAGKTALVTGGSRGIGRAIVWALAREGARVAFVYRSNTEAAEQLVKDLELDQRETLAIQADVAEPEAAERVVEQVLETWEQIDILVNNAGIIRDGLLATMDPAVARSHRHQSRQCLSFQSRRHSTNDVTAFWTDHQHFQRRLPFRQPRSGQLCR